MKNSAFSSDNFMHVIHLVICIQKLYLLYCKWITCVKPFNLLSTTHAYDECAQWLERDTLPVVFFGRHFALTRYSNVYAV